MKSVKLQKVEKFMEAMREKSHSDKRYMQKAPQEPTEPCKEIRELRAKLIYEECIETIKALGVKIYTGEKTDFDISSIMPSDLEFVAENKFDMIEVMDGLADIEVVTLGTYVACGLDDVEIFDEVHLKNMEKFPEGYDGLRDDGKWIKPESWTPPNLKPILEMQKI